jgi:hypothetical protein
MSYRITITPAPSGGGVILRDRFTRAEIFIEDEELDPLANRLRRAAGRPASPDRRRA